MLLTIDVGNTQTVIGLFEEPDRLISHWRVSTNPDITADEIGLLLNNFLNVSGLNIDDVGGVATASVVPAVTDNISRMSKSWLNIEPLIVDINNAGVRAAYQHPREIGADRLANAAAGLVMFGAPLIIIDFGTATTFDVINKDGAYLGGVIAPGIKISAAALFATAAKLSRVPLKAPAKTIGVDTASSIQSGLIFGAAAMVDGLTARLNSETKNKPRVIATGGLAELIAPHCRTISHTEPLLTLYGLRHIHQANS